MNNSRYEASSNLLPRSSSLSSSLSLDTEKAQSHAAAAAVGSSSTSLSSSDAVSPTTLMDAYGRPSIDSFAADLTSERYGKREIYDDDDDEDEDETAFSHHHHHQGLAAPGKVVLLSLRQNYEARADLENAVFYLTTISRLAMHTTTSSIFTTAPLP